MALFGLKEVLDPLANEFREGYRDVRELLAQINEGVLQVVELTQTTNRITAAQLDATQETNRLLHGLVELGAGGPGSTKAEIVKRTLGRD